SDRGTDDRFGSSVAISGSYVIVGAKNEDEDASGNNTLVDAGSVYIFEPSCSTTGTDVQTACDSYDWIDGITYTSSNNTATYVLPNAAGCDSTVTLDLTVNYSTTGTDVQTACDSYDWIDGITYTASNNTATWMLTTGSGCDSLVTLDLTVYAIGSFNLLSDEDTLCSNVVDYANLGWTNTAGVPYISMIYYETISNNPSGSFVTAGEYYAIGTTQDGCEVQSGNTVVIHEAFCPQVTINELIGNSITVYPNPTSGMFTVSLGELKGASISVLDLSGKEIYTLSHVNDDHVEISLNNYSNGVYFVHVQSNEQQKIIKLVKQ
ncbi:MAG: T9SS type A sorting domain-containing protein, partial [Crocinitomicaceae bacterium]|nr:T9SS type A sorting domain-containing protein [Crocinitomicaceae bacterium]